MHISGILKDSQLQQQFNKKGFLVIELLSAEQVQYLSELYRSIYTNEQGRGMMLGGLNNDILFKRGVSEKIIAIIADSLSAVFSEYHIQSASFVVKNPGKHSEFLPHQDWTMVDENKSVSCNIWMPLQDITMQNGPIFVLPGSHYLNYPIKRSHSFGYYFDNHRNIVYKYLMPVLVNCGQAVLLNHSLIHYSSPNFSDVERRVVICAMKSKGAQDIMYYKPAGKELLETYEMPEDIAFRYSEFASDRGLKPYGKLVATEPFTGYNYSSPEINRMFKDMLLRSGEISTGISLWKLKMDNLRRKWSGYYPE